MNAKKDDLRHGFGISKFYQEEMSGGLFNLRVTGACESGDDVYVGVYTINAAGFHSLTEDIKHFNEGNNTNTSHTKKAEIVDATCWRCVDGFENIAEDRIVAAFRMYMEETDQKFDLQIKLFSSGPTEIGSPSGCP